MIPVILFWLLIVAAFTSTGMWLASLVEIAYHDVLRWDHSRRSSR